MANNKYVVTGRYMNGVEVTGYHIVSGLGKNQRKVTREQLILLIGRGEIANCTGEIYKNQVLIRGVNGINIGELPVIDEKTGRLRNMDSVTNVKPKSGDMSKVLGQVTLTARLMDGRKNIGFEVKNYGGQIGRLSRESVIELAERKLITNAVVQNLNKNGKNEKLIRGAGVDLRDLPTISIEKFVNAI